MKNSGRFMQIGTDTTVTVTGTPRTGQTGTAANGGHAPGRTADHEALWSVAKDLEASFLAEMLKHSGLGATSGPFDGGAGEEQFASFLTQEHARLFAERGGIGLAESIFRALTAQAGTS
jgi:Rod binding domain-containing protein